LLDPNTARGQGFAVTVRKQLTAHRRRSAPRPRGLWQLLIAACLLAGSFTDVWRVGHLLAVRHVACPYDGVLVHEDELPADARVSHSAREAKRVSVTPRHEHSDCADLGLVDRPLAVVAVSAPAVARVGQVAVARLALVATAVRRSVLSYAPKLPPPV
jgi:hypothetical protein